MIDRDIIKNIKYDEDCAAEDFELWMKLSEKTEFYIIPDVMMKIRLENGGLHERNRRNIDLAHKKILKQVLGQLGIDANDKEIKFHINYMRDKIEAKEIIKDYQLKLESNFMLYFDEEKYPVDIFYTIDELFVMQVEVQKFILTIQGISARLHQ